MPNWCLNTLIIEGDNTKALSKLQAQVVCSHTRCGMDKESCTSQFSFDAIVPMPEEIKQTTSPQRDEELAEYLVEKYGAADWFDWSVRNWGTKWETDGFLVDANPHFLDYRLDTAWAPPIPAIQTLSGMYPELGMKLEYDEPGGDFWGVMEFVAGEIVAEVTGHSRINEQFEVENYDENSVDPDIEDVPDEDDEPATTESVQR